MTKGGKSKKPGYLIDQLFFKPLQSGSGNGSSNGRKSKGQDSRKVHDTKGKNNHGRSF